MAQAEATMGDIPIKWLMLDFLCLFLGLGFSKDRAKENEGVGTAMPGNQILKSRSPLGSF